MYMYRSNSEKICFHTDHLRADEQVFFSFKDNRTINMSVRIIVTNI